MNVKAHSRSFAGGEITPEMWGRIDLTKFQTGLAKCLNFWVLAHGPVQNRPGFAYVNEVKDSTRKTRLIPFSYNTEQTFAIEFGHQYIRWHTNGGTLLEANQSPTGISVASPAVWTRVAHGYAVGEWVYVSGVTGTFGARVNGRFLKVGTVPTADTYTVTDLAGAAINSTTYTVTGFGTTARVYEIASTYVEADLFDLHFTQSNDVLTITHPTYPPRELKRLGATNWTITNISFVPTIATPAAPTVVASPASGATVNTYKTTAIAADTLEESLASAGTSATNDLSVAGNINTVTPAAVSGAVRYNIYKLFNGLYGYIGQTDGSAFADKNVTPDVSKTPAEANTPFNAAGDYPNAVGYYESRRAFAGTTNKPQNYWLTRSATESNLSYSIPTRDDDTIQGKAKANQVNAIRHIVDANEQLVFLTSGGGWKLTPSNSDILTPTSALPKRFTGEGAANVQPVSTADEVIYIGESGSRLFALKFKWEAQGLVADDLSLMAPHLFDDYTFSDVTYAKGPKMIWSVRSDGKLIGTTYLPRHEVFAMHQHDTAAGGIFESVCSVKESGEYPAYAVIKRTLNGRTARCIERMHSRRFTALEDAFIVDCGLTYSGAAATTITGLWHLEGESVAILADGAEVAPQTVVDGTITIENASTPIHIGLAITADVQGLPLVLEALAASGQANLKNISEVWLRVKDSGGIKVGPDFNNLREHPARSNENYDTPPRLKNGVVHIVIDNNWSIDSQISIRQTAPLPLTISSMTLLVKAGG